MTAKETKIVWVIAGLLALVAFNMDSIFDLFSESMAEKELSRIESLNYFRQGETEVVTMFSVMDRTADNMERRNDDSREFTFRFRDDSELIFIYEPGAVGDGLYFERFRIRK